MKRILMLSSQPLFSRGLESLLRKEGDLEIVGCEPESTSALDEIRALKPDVVILDTRGPDGGASVLIARILCEHLATRIVTLNLEDQTIAIYSEEERVAHGVSDLREAIG